MKLVNVLDYKVKGVKVKSWLCEQSVQAAGVGGVNDSQLRILNSHWFSNVLKMITSKGENDSVEWKHGGKGLVCGLHSLMKLVVKQATVEKRNHVNEPGSSTQFRKLWPVDGKELNANLGWRAELSKCLLYKEWISIQYSYSFWQADN